MEHLYYVTHLNYFFGIDENDPFEKVNLIKETDTLSATSKFVTLIVN